MPVVRGAASLPSTRSPPASASHRKLPPKPKLAQAKRPPTVATCPVILTRAKSTLAAPPRAELLSQQIDRGAHQVQQRAYSELLRQFVATFIDARGHPRDRETQRAARQAGHEAPLKQVKALLRELAPDSDQLQGHQSRQPARRLRSEGKHAAAEPTSRTAPILKALGCVARCFLNSRPPQPADALTIAMPLAQILMSQPMLRVAAKHPNQAAHTPDIDEANQQLEPCVLCQQQNHAMPPPALGSSNHSHRVKSAGNPSTSRGRSLT